MIRKVYCTLIYLTVLILDVVNEKDIAVLEEEIVVGLHNILSVASQYNISTVTLPILMLYSVPVYVVNSFALCSLFF